MGDAGGIIGCSTPPRPLDGRTPIPIVVVPMALLMATLTILSGPVACRPNHHQTVRPHSACSQDRGDLDTDAVSGPGIGPHPRALQLSPSSSKAGGAPRNPQRQEWHFDSTTQSRRLEPFPRREKNRTSSNETPHPLVTPVSDHDRQGLPSNPDTVGFGKRPARNGL